MSNRDETDLTDAQRWARGIAQDMTNPRWVVCPQRKHPSFLVDSESMLGCPWCSSPAPSSVRVSQSMGTVEAGSTIVGYSSR